MVHGRKVKYDKEIGFAVNEKRKAILCRMGEKGNMRLKTECKEKSKIVIKKCRETKAKIEMALIKQKDNTALFRYINGFKKSGVAFGQMKDFFLTGLKC